MAIVVTADHDQHMTALDRCDHIGHADPLQKQLLLYAQVGHGVVSERLDLVGQAVAGIFQVVLEDLGGIEGSFRDHIARSVDQFAAVQREPVTLVNAGKDVVTDVVDERNPRLEQDSWTQVGIAT
jgi:hypothetical protein